MNVNGVVITSSPAFIPEARSARCRASVPEAHATACFVPIYSATSFSRACTFGPRMN